MKLKFENEIVEFTHTMAVGVNQAEVSLPEMVAGDAFLPKFVHASLDAGSAAPSVTGPGLTLFALMLVGKEQASPTNLLSLEWGFWHDQLSQGATSAQPLTFRRQFGTDPGLRDVARQGFPQRPITSAFIFGHTINMSNAPTTIVRLRLIGDVMSLTLQEQIKYLR